LKATILHFLPGFIPRRGPRPATSSISFLFHRLFVDLVWNVGEEVFAGQGIDILVEFFFWLVVFAVCRLPVFIVENFVATCLGISTEYCVPCISAGGKRCVTSIDALPAPE
jgi:hypothetical protein